MVAARGAHHLLGQGRDLAVLLGGRWRDLAGGDREVEAGEAQQDGHSLPRDVVVRVMLMLGTAALASPWTVAPAIDGPAGAASGRGGWASGGGGGSTCCPGGAASG